MEDKELYTIIYKDDNMIQCLGIYPYFEAIGHLVCDIADDEYTLVELNKYKVIEMEDFNDLEGDTGYGWKRVFRHTNADNNTDTTINEIWYLLKVPNTENP